MRGGRCSVLLLAATFWAGCQLAAHDELRRHPPAPRPPKPARVALGSGGTPGEQPAPVSAGGETETGPGVVEGEGEAGAEPGGAPDPRRLDALARLRESFVASAKEIVGTNAWVSIPELAARIAGQASKVPGWREVSAADLEPPLRETAVHSLVCRALRDGAGACASADAVFADGAAVCTDAVRVLQQARALRARAPFDAAAKAVGFPDDGALIDAARAALVAGDAAQCARLGGTAGQPHGWSETLCRAVAAGDPARCDGATVPHHRSFCRGLSLALLDAVGRPSSAADPLQAMYRRWSLGGDVAPECLAEPLAVLALDPAVQAAFSAETAPLVPTP